MTNVIPFCENKGSANYWIQIHMKHFSWLFKIYTQKRIHICCCFSKLWKLNAFSVKCFDRGLDSMPSIERMEKLLCFTKTVIKRFFNVFENIQDQQFKKKMQTFFFPFFFLQPPEKKSCIKHIVITNFISRYFLTQRYRYL